MADKIFRCFQNFLNTIDESEYTNNTPVEKSAVNIPEVQVSNWDDVKTLDKTAILAAAAADGFEVIP